MMTMKDLESLRRCETAVSLAFLFAVTFTGCGKKEIKVKGAPADAGAIVTQVLDTWKAGETPDVLLDEQPPIRVRDEDWEGGHKLESYEFDGAPEENGGHWRVYVNIKSSVKEQPATSSRVVYAVSLGEKPSVLRSDFLN